MAVATFVQPDSTTQQGNGYKGNIDASIEVMSRIARWFAAHEQSTPDMTIRVDAGNIWRDGNAYTEVAAQNTATIVAPSTNPRYDRIVVDKITGAVSVIAGTEDPSPSVPAVTTGKIPVAYVLLQTSTTEITNSIITDDRFMPLGVAHGGDTMYGNLIMDGGQVIFDKGGDVASASTIDLDAVAGNYCTITGTTTITSVTLDTGRIVFALISAAGLTIEHSSSLFITNNARDYNSAASDLLMFVGHDSGAVIVVPFFAQGLGEIDIADGTTEVRFVKDNNIATAKLIRNQNVTGGTQIAGLAASSLNSAATETLMADITFVVDDSTDTSEDARVLIGTNVGGTKANRINIGNGFVVGVPTGGHKGDGTLNATEIYENNVRVLTANIVRGDLSTSTEAASTDALESYNTSASGGYGFNIGQYNDVNSVSIGDEIFHITGGIPIRADGTAETQGSDTSTYNWRVHFGTANADTGHTQFIQLRYIAACPPYDLGDGEVGGFLWGAVNGSGAVVHMQMSEDPLWAHNGPTKIICDFVHKGKEYRWKRPVKVTLQDVEAGTKTMDDLLKYHEDLETMIEASKVAYNNKLGELSNPDLRKLERITIESEIDGIVNEYAYEITQEIKRADMDLYPHPWLGMDLTGLTPVIIDPMDPIVRRFIKMEREGEPALKLFHDDYFRVDNEELPRAKPKDIICVSPKARFTRQ